MSRLSPLPLRLLLLGVLVVVAPACGKRGPPLPPLRPAPGPVTDVTVVRREDSVIVRFSTPIKNMDGTEPVLFDRAEIYALTVSAGKLSPDPSKVVQPKNRVGELGKQAPPAPKPATADATAAPDEPPVARPLVFVEKVAMDTTAPPAQPAAPLKPVPTAVPVPTVPPVTATSPAAAGATATPPVIPGLAVTTRFYVIVPYANRKRVGAVSDLLPVPIGAVPVAPQQATLTYDETTVTLTWVTGEDGETFHVYDATPPLTETAKPLTLTPLAVTTFTQPVVFGKPVCLQVRGVKAAPLGPISLESAPVNAACVTPVDTFPPPAPSGLIAFAATGSMTLTWDGVTAADLAGYLVLRGEGTGEKLQPLSATPVTGTSFTDTTARAGTRYIYAVVAVDNAVPANRSKESNRVEETGR